MDFVELDNLRVCFSVVNAILKRLAVLLVYSASCVQTAVQEQRKISVPQLIWIQFLSNAELQCSSIVFLLTVAVQVPGLERASMREPKSLDANSCSNELVI